MFDHNPNHALVVDRGANAGYFCSGVLDAFIAEDFYPFHHTLLVVSAGSTMRLSYLYPRALKVVIALLRPRCRARVHEIRRYLKGVSLYAMSSWLWHTSVERNANQYACIFKTAIFRLTVVEPPVSSTATHAITLVD